MTAHTITILKKSRQQILTNWARLQSMENPDVQNLLSMTQLNDQSSQLFSVLLERLTDHETPLSNKEAVQNLEDYLHGLAVDWRKIGFTPTDTITFIFNLKQCVLLALQQNLQDLQLLHVESQRLEKMLDSLGIGVFESAIHLREREIFRQNEEIESISTPIIKVWDGIVALPIIGTLDSSRTQDMMNELLQKVAKDNIMVCIVDISGVPAIDSTVAQHLIKLVSAIRLLGGDCIISGLRPEIAQTIVNLGIDLQRIKTKATLADALRIAFSTIGLHVNKRIAL